MDRHERKDGSDPRLLVRASEAARMIDVSRATWHRMVSAGKVPSPVRLSAGAVRWRTADLADWVRWGCPDRSEFERLRGNFSREK